MELTQWQQRFERWLGENHTTDDTAHDISHFRRVWMTAQKIMANQAVEPLVILTACYFHDIVSLPKNHPERGQSSQLAARKTREILHRDFPDFPPRIMTPWRMLLRRTASAPGSRRRVWKRKLCRMLTGWKR